MASGLKRLWAAASSLLTTAPAARPAARPTVASATARLDRALAALDAVGRGKEDDETASAAASAYAGTTGGAAAAAPAASAASDGGFGLASFFKRGAAAQKRRRAAAAGEVVVPPARLKYLLATPVPQLREDAKCSAAELLIAGDTALQRHRRALNAPGAGLPADAPVDEDGVTMSAAEWADRASVLWSLASRKAGEDGQGVALFRVATSSIDGLGRIPVNWTAAAAICKALIAAQHREGSAGGEEEAWPSFVLATVMLRHLQKVEAAAAGASAPTGVSSEAARKSGVVMVQLPSGRASASGAAGAATAAASAASAAAPSAAATAPPTGGSGSPLHQYLSQGLSDASIPKALELLRTAAGPNACELADAFAMGLQAAWDGAVAPTAASTMSALASDEVQASAAGVGKPGATRMLMHPAQALALVRDMARVKGRPALLVPASALTIAHIHSLGLKAASDDDDTDAVHSHAWLALASLTGDPQAAVELASRVGEAAKYLRARHHANAAAASERAADASGEAVPAVSATTAASSPDLASAAVLSEFAWNLWRKAAAAGHPLAQHNLGVHYLLGSGDAAAGGGGSEVNPALALQWFTSAAKQGFMRSAVNAAAILERGAAPDVEQDLPRAAVYYERALQLMGVGSGGLESARKAAAEAALRNPAVAHIKRRLDRVVEAMKDASGKKARAMASEGDVLVDGDDGGHDGAMQLDFNSVEERDAAIRAAMAASGELAGAASGSLASGGLPGAISGRTLQLLMQQRETANIGKPTAPPPPPMQ